jgi:hypothetical protein
MGEIQQMSVTQDVVLIQEPREYYLRAPPWTTWTEVRLAMMFTMVPTGNFSSYAPAETIGPLTNPSATYLDWFCWGLKDTSSNLPGAAGSQFIGLGWGSGGVAIALASNLSGNGNIGSGGAQIYIAQNGATNVATSTDAGFVLSFPQYSPTAYCFTNGLRFVVNNAGLSTQTVTASYYANIASLAGDYSVAKLRTDTFNTSYSGSKTLTWNSGGVALALPCCWYLRMPFNLSRARISTMGMWKVS